MTSEFSAARQRNYWLKYGLDGELDFRPDSVSARAIPNYVHLKVGSCINAAFVGLLPRVMPTIESIFAWMREQPEPIRSDFSDDDGGWGTWLYALYSWRESYGLCQWLRGDSGDLQLGKAAGAWVTSLVSASSEDAERASRSVRRHLFTALATALAGNAPELGMALYRVSRIQKPSGSDAPFVGFGVWACNHLADGGGRGQSYIDQGQMTLSRALSKKFEQRGGSTELALWLKAIFFDTGVVSTAEDSMLKAYDFMPGVPRPDLSLESGAS